MISVDYAYTFIGPSTPLSAAEPAQEASEGDKDRQHRHPRKAIGTVKLVADVSERYADDTYCHRYFVSNQVVPLRSCG